METRIFLLSLFLVSVVFTSGCMTAGNVADTSDDNVRCQENWVCTDWSECSGGVSTRACSDSSNCGTQTSKPSETKTCIVEEPPEAEVKAEMFVRSQGTIDVQFLKAYVPVMELLSDVADIEIKFMEDIAHGLNEMQSNTGIHCVQEEEKDKLPDYLRCFLRYGNQENFWDRICPEEAGVNMEIFSECVNRTDEEFNLTKDYEESRELFPPYSLNEDLVDLYEVEKSPTLVVNGEITKIKANPENIKDAICSEFETLPEECEEELSSSTASVGFGPVKYPKP